MATAKKVAARIDLSTEVDAEIETGDDEEEEEFFSSQAEMLQLAEAVERLASDANEEEEEEDDEPELLRLALDNVLQALSSSTMSFDQAELHRQKLDEILSQPGSLAIYGLAIWLNEFGLKLTVNVHNQDD